MNTMNNQELAQALLQTTEDQAKHIGNLVDVVDRLDREVASKPSKKKVYGFTAILCAVILIIVCGIGWKLLDVAQTNKNTLNLIESCVKPEGECAQKSAAQTQTVVNQIICNQERLAFILVEDYKPNPICITFIEQTTGKKVAGG